MKTPPVSKLISPSLEGARRKQVRVSARGLVGEEFLSTDDKLPLVMKPALRGVDLTAWAENNRDSIQTRLLEYGGILFRGFNVSAANEFEQFIRAVHGELLEYKERSSPRTEVADRIYTSTDYPADQGIFLHNENSYQQTWPLKIFFFCHTPAEQGGETPIADCREIFKRIDPMVRDRFREKGWTYVRNFGDGFGLSWQAVFQTTDKTVVEEHCSRNGISVEWKEGNRLKTRSVRPAIARHPKTGEEVWFNHATFFHVTTLDPKVRNVLLEEFQEDDLPTNTYYGDGAPIEAPVLEHLRSAYRQQTISFRWEQGDILLLDNMLTAHGRMPYVGQRKVLVGMAEPITTDERARRAESL